MSGKRKITDKNLYELFEVLSSSTEQEIKKAYRKRALKCHPDKNPDNPKAAELFHELSEALEILLDEKARLAYDRTLRAKEQAKERIKELDSKRRKLRDDLEKREQAAREGEKQRQAARRQYQTNLSEEESLQKEVERLRKEGSRALQEEQEAIRQQILKEQQGKYSYLSNQEQVTEGPRIKVKWSKGDKPKDYDELMTRYSKYGKVATLVVGKKCAIVEFHSQDDADKAYEGEESSGLQLEWMSKISLPQKNTCSSTSSARPPPPPQTQNFASCNNPSSFADFEAMILGKLSAAAAAQKQTQEEPSPTLKVD